MAKTVFNIRSTLDVATDIGEVDYMSIGFVVSNVLDAAGSNEDIVNF